MCVYFYTCKHTLLYTYMHVVVNIIYTCMYIVVNITIHYTTTYVPAELEGFEHAVMQAALWTETALKRELRSYPEQT